MDLVPSDLVIKKKRELFIYQFSKLLSSVTFLIRYFALIYLTNCQSAHELEKKEFSNFLFLSMTFDVIASLTHDIKIFDISKNFQNKEKMSTNIKKMSLMSVMSANVRNIQNVLKCK